MPDAAHLKITLCDIDPAPWREVYVPLSMTLESLHHTIQALFQWCDCHLWEFEISGKRYGLPMEDPWGGPPVLSAAAKRLSTFRNLDGLAFRYTYDFGDDWDHRIQVVSLFEAPSGSRYPAFLTGAHRAPPEDIGGAPGFEYFLEAMADPSHPEHGHFKDWYGEEVFDPDDIDEELVRIQMNRLSRQRRPKA